MPNQQHHYDYLIIGQGLAGSVLALHLLAKNKRIRVIDNDHASSSSMVAAGMITPLAGRRLAKSWKIDEALPYARTFYQQCESFTQGPCFFARTIHRLMKNQEEALRLKKRIHDPRYTPYLGEVRAPLTLQHTHADTLGSVDILQAGYLAVSDFLIATRAHFQQQKCYAATSFEHAELELHTAGVRYQTITADTVIFCEGWQGQRNPWFNWLPFNSAKGDILTLETPDKTIRNVYNQRKWVLPLENNQLKVGATYTRESLDCIPQASARAELLTAFQTLLPNIRDYQIVHHQAGVRPLTIDNHPFIGRHPQHPQLAIFNGFGSKGSLFIPLLADHFTHHLEHQAALWTAANINRHWPPKSA